MRPADLFYLGEQLLRELLPLPLPADALVAAFFRRHRALGARERAPLAQTAFEILRRRRWYAHLAAHGAGALERRLLLLAWQGAATLRAEALRSGEGDWLAQAERRDPREAPDDALRHNLPDWLAHRLQDEVGAQFWPLAKSLLEPAPLDLRVNTLKLKRDAAIQALGADGLHAEPTPYSPWGLRLRDKPQIQRHPLLESGALEIQDEGSQLLALIVGAGRGQMVADFCAGAGGKTLALGAAMRSTGRLYALDVSGHRLAALKPRLARSGLSNVYPIQIAHERDERIKRLAGKLDRVLVDAPCTGLGTLRRNPDLKWRQREADAAELALKQQAILASAATLLKPQGRLVYATCSLLAQENEAVVAGFEDAVGARWRVLPVGELLAESLEGAQRLVQGPYLRLWPHRHGCDGFFAAAWERVD